MRWIYRSGVSLLTALAVLGTAGAAHAKALCPAGYEALCKIKLGEDTGGIISWAMTLFFIIAILVSLFFVLFGAFRWITSGGDQNKVAQARQTLISAIVGLVIALSTFFIINIVMYIFTGKGLSDLGSINIKLY
jgi:hypothetical protein